MKLILQSHAYLINGKMHEVPSNILQEALKSTKSDFIYIRHSIDGKFKSNLNIYKKGMLTKTIILPVIEQIQILRYITEVLSSVLFLIWISITNRNKLILVNIDPLNAMSGVILKYIGATKFTVFYTADYTPTRFSNNLLNRIFKWIDKFDVMLSDEVWNVSQRIFDIRQKSGLGANKNKFIPNVPAPIYKKYINNQRDRFTLITLGMLSDQMDYIGLFDSISLLKEKFPKIKLKVIGSGEKDADYKQYVEQHHLNDYIKFFGQINYEDALKEVSESGIGIALYNSNWNFNYYGDSMKCREYFCFGLPVLTTNTHSTVEDIKKYEVGIVSNMDSLSYFEGIDSIIKNYEYYSKNSKKLGMDYDGVHIRELSRIQNI